MNRKLAVGMEASIAEQRRIRGDSKAADVQLDRQTKLYHINGKGKPNKKYNIPDLVEK